MREKRKKSIMSLRKKLFITALGLFFLVLIIVSLFGKKGLLETYQSQKKHRALLQEIGRLEKEKTKLERDIEELDKNPKAIEEKAREKLWLVKPGEIVLVKEKK